MTDAYHSPVEARPEVGFTLSRADLLGLIQQCQQENESKMVELLKQTEERIIQRIVSTFQVERPSLVSRGTQTTGHINAGREPQGHLARDEFNGRPTTSNHELLWAPTDARLSRRTKMPNLSKPRPNSYKAQYKRTAPKRQMAALVAGFASLSIRKLDECEFLELAQGTLLPEPSDDEWSSSESSASSVTNVPSTPHTELSESPPPSSPSKQAATPALQATDASTEVDSESATSSIIKAITSPQKPMEHADVDLLGVLQGPITSPSATSHVDKNLQAIPADIKNGTPTSSNTVIDVPQRVHEPSTLLQTPLDNLMGDAKDTSMDPSTPIVFSQATSQPIHITLVQTQLPPTTTVPSSIPAITTIPEDDMEGLVKTSYHPEDVDMDKAAHEESNSKPREEEITDVPALHVGNAGTALSTGAQQAAGSSATHSMFGLVRRQNTENLRVFTGWGGLTASPPQATRSKASQVVPPAILQQITATPSRLHINEVAMGDALPSASFVVANIPKANIQEVPSTLSALQAPQSSTSLPTAPVTPRPQAIVASSVTPKKINSTPVNPYVFIKPAVRRSPSGLRVALSSPTTTFVPSSLSQTTVESTTAPLQSTTTAPSPSSTGQTDHMEELKDLLAQVHTQNAAKRMIGDRGKFAHMYKLPREDATDMQHAVDFIITDNSWGANDVQKAKKEVEDVFTVNRGRAENLLWSCIYFARSHKLQPQTHDYDLSSISPTTRKTRMVGLFKKLANVNFFLMKAMNASGCMSWEEMKEVVESEERAFFVPGKPIAERGIMWYKDFMSKRLAFWSDKANILQFIADRDAAQNPQSSPDAAESSSSAGSAGCLSPTKRHIDVVEGVETEESKRFRQTPDQEHDAKRKSNDELTTTKGAKNAKRTLNSKD